MPGAAETTTAGGFLLVLSIMLPVGGILLAMMLGGRHVRWIVLVLFPAGFAVAAAVFGAVWRGDALAYVVGGWAPPLGIVLRADGIAAAMMLTTAVVICATGVFAWTDFRQPPEQQEQRRPLVFWCLLLSIWCALNAVVLGGDLFNLYVALELLTFAAVPLVCLNGEPETIRAALRYLLFALVGSVLYLLGTALLYGAYGTLDIVLLSQRVRPEPAAWVAGALMTVGLLAKTALFPLHLWLPPAHAGAPAAGSAVLSALVVKGSFIIIVRLWFDVMPGLMSVAGAQLLGGLAAAAIVFGSVVALRQERLKLLIAYSTLAQIGMLFVMFPLAFQAGSAAFNSDALMGGLLQTLAHATAKAAMFMAAGLIYVTLGHDRIAQLGGSWRAAPVSVLALVVSGIALVGLPPSGAYLAKSLFVQAAADTHQPWWRMAVEASGIFTSCYLILVLAHVFMPARTPVPTVSPERFAQAAPAVALALCSLALGLLPWGTAGWVSAESMPAPFSLDALTGSLWPLLGGALLAILLGRWRRPAPGAGRDYSLAAAIQGWTRVLARPIEWLDALLRQWLVATLLLLALTLVFGAAVMRP